MEHQWLCNISGRISVFKYQRSLLFQEPKARHQDELYDFIPNGAFIAGKPTLN
jgi:hypothetical protein